MAVLTVPTVARAQAYQCTVPQDLLPIHPELPSADQPRRLLPIGGYTLAVSWSPQYCRGHADGPGAAVECNGGNRFGFTLHGLWPYGVGRDWPQYCRATGLLPQPLVRRHLCSTPSAQLLQHEWAKHGTCMPGGERPATYFARSTRLYGRLRYPDMTALSRSAPLTAGRIAAAIATANPGMTADMMRVTADRDGWLAELWICLDKKFRYARCPATQSGLADRAPVRIWRGVR